MKTLAVISLLFVSILFAGQYEDRWFYVSRNLNSDQDLTDVEELVRTAGKVDLNGMLFACGVEHYESWTPERRSRLAKLRKTCDENGVEIIPIIWSIGYGTMLGRNPNYVEGIAVTDVPYVAKDGKAMLKKDDTLLLENGGFEKHDGNRFPINGWIDESGKRSFVDTEVKHGGECSVRLENLASNKHGHGRICLQVKLMPHRRYRMRVFAKTEGLVPNKSKFMLQFYRMNGSQIATLKPDIAPTQDWKEYSLAFFSGDESEGRFFVGMWGGEQGKLWIDDNRLEMDGVTDVIRRPGTPFTVKNAATGQIYEEGKDYGNVEG